jgi:hypothetical protein
VADGGDVAGVHQRSEPLRHLLRGGCLRRLLHCWLSSATVGRFSFGLSSENGGLASARDSQPIGFRLLSPWHVTKKRFSMTTKGV